MPTDFITRLAPTANTEQFLRDASAWTAAAGGSDGLRLLSASAQPTAPTDTQLARTDLSLQVQGRYPALKGWLRELMARYPSLALLGMDLRRDAGPVAGPAADQVQATLRLRLYAQPLRVAAAGSAP